MKPTMVVSPGQPIPGQNQQFGEFGNPPHMGVPPQPQKKSRIGLYLGMGCGCLTVIGIGVFAAVYFLIISIMPGEEITSVEITPNVPFTLSYTQDGDKKHELWMELDVSHPQGLSLTGPISISDNDTVIGQYNLDCTGSGSPIRERSSSQTYSWVSTNSKTSGHTLLFPYRSRTGDVTVTISGNLTASPGVTVNRLRFYVTD